MSARVPQPSNYTLPLSEQEREVLLGLLRQSLGEARIEVHRTHTPEFRELVEGQEALIRALIEKLEGPGPARFEPEPLVPGGIEEQASVIEDLYIDDGGRFQMAAADLDDFIRFLRDHEVRVEVESAEAFRSGGEAYGYGRLIHPYDVDSASALFRTWKLAQGSRAAVSTA